MAQFRLKNVKPFKDAMASKHSLHPLARWEFNTFVPREFIVNGSMVVVLGEEIGTDKTSGLSFANRWAQAHLFEIHDGHIQRFREFLCHWTGNQQPPPMSWSMA